MKKRRSFKGSLIIITLSIIIILCAFVALKTDFFYLKNINILGNKIVKENQIIKASGLKGNINILFADKDLIENNILEIPRVKSVKITKNYPATIEVKIIERELLYYNKTELGYEMIDNDGVQYDFCEEIEDENPILNIENRGEMSKEQLLLEISEIVKQNSWNKDIKMINFNEKTIKINTSFGISVVFVGVNDIQYSVRFAQKILNDLIQKGTDSGEIHFYNNADPVYFPSEEEM